MYVDKYVAHLPPFRAYLNKTTTKFTGHLSRPGVRIDPFAASQLDCVIHQFQEDTFVCVCVFFVVVILKGLFAGKNLGEG